MALRKGKGVPSMAVLIGMGGGKGMKEKPMMDEEEAMPMKGKDTGEMQTEETLSLEFGAEDIPEFKGAKAGDKVVLTGTLDRMDKEGGRVYFDSFKMAEKAKPKEDEDELPMGATREQISESINKKKTKAIKAQEATY